MDSVIIAEVIEHMHHLPADLQQEVLTFVAQLRANQVNPPTSNAWDVLEVLTGTIEAPADWSQEHDHYLYDLPKQNSDA